MRLTGRRSQGPCCRRFAAALLAVATVIVPARRAAPQSHRGATIELYVDESTGQVFTKPGKGRTPLGTFQRVEPGAKPAPAPAPAAAPVAAAPPAPAGGEPAATAAPVATVDEKQVSDAVAKTLATKWYERLSIRGYTQFRYNALLHKDGDAEWFVPTDRSVRPDAGFFIRRARLILSGDVSNHVYVYIQPEMNALPADGDFSVQLRDAYTDVALDAKKEFRFRLGQSKVPYGWVNLQSSQNRLALERPDAINSAAENERDIGVFFYWAPAEIRDRFRMLVRDGLKGSGDYGVFGVGMYNGQGPNHLDSNGNLHAVARLTYPFMLPNGQYIEPGIQGYWGRFVPRRSDIPVGPDDSDIEPSDFEGGRVDRRIAVSFIVYPQPFGFETEWNLGDGPELVDGDTQIGTRFLWGGYVQASYRAPFQYGVLFPFVRWQRFDGGRKFARNAPHDRVNEWDFGVEYTPWPELEFTLMYTYTPFRTNTNAFDYGEFTDASRLGMQVQWNY